MQVCRVGSEQTEQVPKKEHYKRQGKHKLIRHLRRQTGGVVSRRFPDQASENSPHRAQYFHVSQSLLCRPEISIKLAESPSPPSSPSGRGSRNAEGEGEFLA